MLRLPCVITACWSWQGLRDGILRHSALLGAARATFPHSSGRGRFIFGCRNAIKTYHGGPQFEGHLQHHNVRRERPKEKTCPCVGDIFNVGDGMALAKGVGVSAALGAYRVRWFGPWARLAGRVGYYRWTIDSHSGDLEDPARRNRAEKSQAGMSPSRRQPNTPTTAASPGWTEYDDFSTG